MLTETSAPPAPIAQTSFEPVSAPVTRFESSRLIVLIALVIHLATGLTRFPPTLYGKITTVVQVVTVCFILLFNSLSVRSDRLIPGLVILTLFATLFSGFHYILHGARLAASAPEAGR